MPEGYAVFLGDFRLALAIRTRTPTMKVADPVISHGVDLPVIGWQFTKHNIGRT